MVSFDALRATFSREPSPSFTAPTAMTAKPQPDFFTLTETANYLASQTGKASAALMTTLPAWAADGIATASENAPEPHALAILGAIIPAAFAIYIGARAAFNKVLQPTVLDMQNWLLSAGLYGGIESQTEILLATASDAYRSLLKHRVTFALTHGAEGPANAAKIALIAVRLKSAQIHIHGLIGEYRALPQTTEFRSFRNYHHQLEAQLHALTRLVQERYSGSWQTDMRLAQARPWWQPKRHVGIFRLRQEMAIYRSAFQKKWFDKIMFEAAQATAKPAE